MALKDWRKTGDDEWHKFTSNGKKPKEGQFYDGIFFVKTVNNDYIISSFYTKFPHEYKKREFKTKAQALAFAKRYMRKN